MYGRLISRGLAFGWLTLTAAGVNCFSAGTPRCLEPRALTGTIYPAGKTTPSGLFRFTRTATPDGNRVDVKREYFYPDGKVAARERVTYEGDKLAFYELEEIQIGAKGTARIQKDSAKPGKETIQFEYIQGGGAKRRTASETLEPDTLVADSIVPFLLSHWDALLNGRELKCRLIVVPRRETVGFTFSRDRDPARQSPGMVVIRMEATSPIIAALVDPMFFKLRTQPPHPVLEYSGRMTPKLKVGTKWKDFDGVTIFEVP